MSQKISEIVNNEGKTIEQVKDEAQRDYNQAHAEYDDLRNKSFQDVQNSTNGSNDGSKQIDRRPSTSVGSQGYNPNNNLGNHSSGNSLGKKDSLNKPGDSSDKIGDKEGLSKDNDSIDKNETAPDIGKDYGESQPPQAGENSGYGPGYSDVGNDVGKQVEKNVPEEAQQQDAQQQGSQQQGQENADPKDKKSNDLDEIDKKKQEEQQENAQENSQKNQGQNGQQQAENNQGTNRGENKTQNNQDTNPTGNGYGALKRNNKNKPQVPDSTQNARRNLDHQNKVNEEKNLKKSAQPRKGLGGGLGGGMMSRLGSRFKGGIKNFFNRANNNFSDGNNGSDSEHNNSFMGDLMNKIMSSITSNPYFLIAAGLIIMFILILLATMDGGSLGGKGGKKVCSYELSGLSSAGKIEIKDAKVELINCDGSEENGYEVLDTIDFEKYILGVTLAEAGPGHQYDDTYKAQLIAVRNFTLTRHLGMCPSHPDDCFHGYNAETNTFRMRACTNDQVYWDYTQDIYTELRDGKPSLYGKEAEANGKIWKKALSTEEIARYEAIAQEVAGEVLLDESGNVLKVGYKASETQRFISMPAEGYNYQEILKEVYGSDSISSAKCTYTGHFDYGDYTLTSDDDTVLNQSLESFLSSNGSSLEEFNKLIEKNVENSGYGTRAGVVAAAVTLIGELGDNYGVKVPYYWGGGHADGVVVGSLGYWGSTECRTSANGRVYDRCGLDCSGFVPWAIKNGGFNMSQNLASNFQYINGARRVSLNSSSAVVQPGDLLESESHVVLVVAIDEENKQYICAEAAGYDYGVLFVRRSFGSDGYWGVDMENYYNNEANVRSAGK